MPSQIFKYQGIPLKSSRTLTINLGNQQILSTNLTVEIPTGFYGQVYAPKNFSRFKPHIAPGILIPGHENIFVLIANTAAKFILNFILCCHGCLQFMKTDNGISFKSSIITKLNKPMGIQGVLSTPYYPETNGTVERVNGS